MSDVSAVVLSVGEPYVARAYEAIARQTYPVAEVVHVEHVSPFHRALNEAARRVSTPFFLQVDADMVPDPTCISELRTGMDDTTGVVCGALRDPLMGEVIGIKLFRTEVVRRHAIPDTVAQDVDFMHGMERAGWALRYVGSAPPDSLGPARTYGDHRPDYTPAYTFQKFLVEGRRYRYRGARGGLFWRLEEFEHREHPLIPLARVAQGHGFFMTGERDEHRPVPDDPRVDNLVEMLASPARGGPYPLFPLEQWPRLRDVFRAFADAGRAMAAQGHGGSVHDAWAALRGRRHDWRALVAELALGHGFAGGRATVGTRAPDERALRAFIRYGIGRRVSLASHLRARADHALIRVLRARMRTPWKRSMVPW